MHSRTALPVRLSQTTPVPSWTTATPISAA
nr:MAG TPA: hypothetical protein [Caudoviricetes sp.]